MQLGLDAIHLHDVVQSYKRHIARLESKWKVTKGRVGESGLTLGKLRFEFELSRQDIGHLKGELAIYQEKAREYDTLAATAQAKKTMMDHFSEVNFALFEAKRRVFEASEEAHQEKSQASANEACAHEVEKKAHEVATRAGKAEVCTTAVEQRIPEVEAWATAAEQRLSKVEEKSKRAIEDNLALETFKLEMSDNSVDGFYQGFAECCSQVEKVQPGLNLSGLISRILDTEDSDEGFDEAFDGEED